MPHSEVVQPREIERVPVTSSHLQSVGYDEPSRMMTIEFRDGAIYEYDDEPPEVHSAMMSAESHGKYFHQHVRSAGFPAQQLH